MALVVAAAVLTMAYMQAVSTAVQQSALVLMLTGCCTDIVGGCPSHVTGGL